ncbi:MAG: proton-conducting transporter membrane subunit [Capsulimonadaceae bacterium]
MTALLALLPCPLALAFAALVIRRTGVLTRLAAGLLWLQGIVALRFLSPVLTAQKASYVTHGFRIDPMAAFFVLLTTIVVAAALTHAIGFFAREAQGPHPSEHQHIAQVYFFIPLFLLAMYCVVSADNLGYMWIGMEATTLLSAPLVYYHRSSTSLEATWKYVIVCSVGIAFGFFGTAMLYAGSQQSAVFAGGSLSLTTLAQHAGMLPPGLVRLGYVFILLGYGTKAGLFPLHNWLPDAHSEAPAPASAILSGALLNCALVAIWRVSHLVELAGQGMLVRETLLPMACATVLAAGLFLLRQQDFKRLLAYSSMENVGLMAGAIGLGSGSGFVLQALNHSLIKVALFLVAGNLLQQYGTKMIREMRGLLSIQPAQGMLLLLLVAAVAGTPPFGSFPSEWLILSTAADARNAGVVVAIVLALALAFIAIAIQAADILFGAAPATFGHEAPPGRRVRLSLALVPSVLLAVSLGLGIALTPHLLALAGGIAR